MKQIQLTQGKVALIDDEDYGRVYKFRWHVYQDKIRRKDKFYAIRSGSRKIRHGWKESIKMHRVIMNAKPGQIIDHIDSNGLNNQKSNLRFCTREGNSYNTNKRKGNHSSKYKGVSWHKKINKWTSYIRFNKVLIHLGNYDIEIDAAKAYDKKAKELCKEFAKLNFKEDR